MTIEKEIELRLENMETKINNTNEKIDSTAKYILMLIEADKSNTEKLIATERRNTNIFVGIIVTIVVIAGIKYLLS